MYYLLAQQRSVKTQMFHLHDKYLKMLVFLIDNIFVMFDERFSTDNRYSCGHKLCSPSNRLFPLFVRGIFHTGTSAEKEKEASPIL